MILKSFLIDIYYYHTFIGQNFSSVKMIIGHGYNKKLYSIPSQRIWYIREITDGELMK